MKRTILTAALAACALSATAQIMEAYARPKKDFYAYHIGNGEWLQGVYDGETIQIK